MEMAKLAKQYQRAMCSFPKRSAVENNGDYLRRIENWKFDHKEVFEGAQNILFNEEIQRLLSEIEPYVKT
jgi:hypothetical protein